MAKTYNTIGLVSAGDPLTETIWNEQATNVNNYRVPPAVSVRLTSDKTSFSNNAAVSWDAEDYDTDSMYSSGATITINTAGIYLVTINISATAATTLSQLFLFSNNRQMTTNGATNFASANLSYVASFAAAATVGANVGFVATGAVTLAGTADNQNRGRMTVTWLGQVS
jgi:hypothetical protein